MRSVLFIFIFSLFFLSCKDKTEPASDISLSHIFTDNMVLQQKETIKVWGKAQAGGTVKVAFNGQEKIYVTGNDNKWSVTLDPVKAGGPYELKVIGKDTITLKNVLVGEVWICSGQSNMSMPLNLWGNKRYAQEIKNADYPEIRLLTVKKTSSMTPSEELITNGNWEACSPENAGEFSAVGFFFAKELYKKLKVPIGMIHSSWGGTPVEAWAPAEELIKLNEYTDIIKSFDSYKENKDRLWAEYYQEIDQWKKGLDSLYAEKIGTISWEKQELNDSEWKEINLPGYWENDGMKENDGIVWFRRSLNLSSDPKEKKYTLSLGGIDDQDVVYINGSIVGSHQSNEDKRVYPISKNILHKGANTLAVMVRDYGGNGGFAGPSKEIYLTNDGDEKISLTGLWKYKVLTNDPNRKIPWSSNQPDSPSRPTVLYNAMINPIISFSIRGIIWYQGEANVGRATQYKRIFPGMISAWREKWGEGNFPFYFVQLANYKERKKIPGSSDFALLREAQATALSLPNTGIATAVDVGEADDIHFKNKEDVGHRLALNALNMTYGLDIPFSGPVFKKTEKNGNRITVHFTHTDGGLITNDGKSPKAFALACSDGKYKWANAKIVGNTVVVWNDSISSPLSVRYAWADNPEINLYNKAGLPALPFRTDTY